MVQRIETYCDQHALDDDWVPGSTYSVAIGVPGSPAQTYETDACEAHGKMLADLAGWLSEHGRKVGKGAKPTGAVTCPECGQVVPNRSALGSHARRVHDKTLAELEGAPADLRCPDCSRQFTSNQGLAVHRSRTHGHVASGSTGKAGA